MALRYIYVFPLDVTQHTLMSFINSKQPFTDTVYLRQAHE